MAGLLLMLASVTISIWWGVPLGRSIPGGANDLQVVYYGTRCLMEHCDPYNLVELQGFYLAEEKRLPAQSIERPKAVTWYIYLPPTFLVIAPLAVLPWSVSYALWTLLLVGTILIAATLMVNLGAEHAPKISLLLGCILLANCEVGFALGNSAVFVVSLCTVAAWCFVQGRFVPLGILCLVLGFSFKPHDVDLVWLYFFLSGGVYRKRALKVLALALVVGLAALVWVSQVAPHWMQEWNSNISSLAVRGGLSDPGLTAERAQGAGQVIDLQAAVSVVRDDPGFYNPVSHVVCGALLLIWAFTTLRTRFAQSGTWFALAAIVPLTLLATYHRAYDAKLLLLEIPACAKLWAERGWVGRMAFLWTAASIVVTGDIPLVILSHLMSSQQIANAGLIERLLLVVLTRPAPVILLVLAIFYLWVYVRRAYGEGAAAADGNGLIAPASV
jgi:hypothetical protein